MFLDQKRKARVMFFLSSVFSAFILSHMFVSFESNNDFAGPCCVFIASFSEVTEEPAVTSLTRAAEVLYQLFFKD